MESERKIRSRGQSSLVPRDELRRDSVSSDPYGVRKHDKDHYFDMFQVAGSGEENPVQLYEEDTSSSDDDRDEYESPSQL